MADSDQFGSNTSKAYEDMTRDELVSIVGIEDDPAMSRDELIMMAMEADHDRNSSM